MTMCAASAAAIGISVARVKKDELSENKIPLTGVAGAMIFAAQMVDFAIPGTGSSGHIGGGILLAGLLGGFPAFLAVTAVIIIQCLFFADGGLLALGCNIFNLGVIPCLLIYPLVFKPLLRNGISRRSLSFASVASVVIGLELGAFCVVLQTTMSGITALPFNIFIAFMLPIHLAIGFAEGIITAAVLCFIHKMQPELIDASLSRKQPGGSSMKKPLIALLTLTVVAGGILSLFASPDPDGLEWSVQRTTFKVTGAEAELEEADGIFESGLIGSAITFTLAAAAGLIITKVKKRKKTKVEDV